MSKSIRRPQRQKANARVERVQNIRFSNAAGIHSNQGEYRRPTQADIWAEAEAELADWNYEDDDES